MTLTEFVDLIRKEKRQTLRVLNEQIHREQESLNVLERKWEEVYNLREEHMLIQRKIEVFKSAKTNFLEKALDRKMEYEEMLKKARSLPLLSEEHFNLLTKSQGQHVEPNINPDLTALKKLPKNTYRRKNYRTFKVFSTTKAEVVCRQLSRELQQREPEEQKINSEKVRLLSAIESGTRELISLQSFVTAPPHHIYTEVQSKWYFHILNFRNALVKENKRLGGIIENIAKEWNEAEKPQKKYELIVVENFLMIEAIARHILGLSETGFSANCPENCPISEWDSLNHLVTSQNIDKRVVFSKFKRFFPECPKLDRNTVNGHSLTELWNEKVTLEATISVLNVQIEAVRQGRSYLRKDTELVESFGQELRNLLGFTGKIQTGSVAHCRQFQEQLRVACEMMRSRRSRDQEPIALLRSCFDETTNARISHKHTCRMASNNQEEAVDKLFKPNNLTLESTKMLGGLGFMPLFARHTQT